MPFFVSLYLRHFSAITERRLDPSLEGRPLLVCGRRRVLDLSAEAAAAGVRAGMDRIAARRLCPEARDVDYTPERYWPHARPALDVAARFTPRIEPFRPHEAFLDLSCGPCPPQEWRQIADDLEALGFVPLLGIASTCLVARAAALWRNLKQPYGVGDVMKPADEPEFFGALPLALLWPVDSRIRARLHRLGLHRIADVAGVPPDDLVRQLGPVGDRVSRLARGIDPSRVAEAYPPPVFEAERRFEHAPLSLEALREEVRRLAARVAADLRARPEAAFRVKVHLEFEAHPSAAVEIPLREGIRSNDDLFRAACRALDRLPLSGPPAALRLRVEDLRRQSGVQLDLFGERTRERRLAGLHDRLNRRFGEGTLRNAASLAVPRRLRVLDALERFHEGGGA